MPEHYDSDEAKRLRFESEARGWLRRGYSSPEAIERLKELLQEKRGKRYNVEPLLDEMRRQWRNRAAWLHKGGSG